MEINKPIRNIVGTPTNKRLATNPKLVVSIKLTVLFVIKTIDKYLELKWKNQQIL